MSFDSRSAVHVHPAIRRTFAMLGMVGLSACGANATVGVPADSRTVVSVPADGRSRTADATVGQDIDVTLQNVGPAVYESPPTISSGAVAYLGVDVVPPYLPAGPTQRFRFRAASAGQAIITFRRMLGGSLVSVVEDTVQVR
jgi:hypothetical protein